MPFSAAGAEILAAGGLAVGFQSTRADPVEALRDE